MNARVVGTLLLFVGWPAGCAGGPSKEMVEKYDPREAGPVRIDWADEKLAVWFNPTAPLYLARSPSKVVLLSKGPLEVEKAGAKKQAPADPLPPPLERRTFELGNGTLVVVEFDPALWAVEPIDREGVRIRREGPAPFR